MKNIRRLREVKELTARELSELSGVSATSIRKYELAERDINKASGIILYKLSKVLDCTIEDLLEIDDLK
jgi:transcriptional regulator with XRE-family HTH domain